MNAAAAKLEGVLSVFQTPYLENETIDYDTLSREIDWLYNHGVDGLVMAMVSEVLRLTTDERKQVCEHIIEVNQNRGCVVISVGAESSYAAIDFARHAESSGATAVMAIPPVSIAVSEAEVFLYFQRLIESISLPVIVQDASGYVGTPIPVGTMAQLLDEYGPERVYFKPEAAPIGQKLSQLRDATKKRAGVFEGSGGIFLVDSYQRGIIGTMPGAELIAGIVALWRALESDDRVRIDRLAMPIAAIVSLATGLDGFLAIEKHLLQRQGVFTNTIVRGPVGYKLDAETRQEVDRLFDYLSAALEETA